ncbi:MAG: DUF58 domain-containing protein [Planctomycetes bacterium]|nr:DUF58 domain-containing protein [Planctomycetota bacterium]
MRGEARNPLRTLWRSWKHEITPAGKWLVGAVLLAALGSVTVQIAIYQVLCGVAGLMLVALVVGTIFWPLVEMHPELPDRTVAGQEATGVVRVRNRSWRPIYDLVVGLFDLPPSIAEPTLGETLPFVPRRGTASVPLSLVPERRGIYELPALRAYTSFPFNLFLIGGSRAAAGSLMVLPSFHPLAAIDVPFSPRYQPGGVTLTSNVGESPEYVGNREYVPGEPARRLDFRSWARLGRPVVREFHEEYYCRIALVLDTWLPITRRGQTPFPASGSAELKGAARKRGLPPSPDDAFEAAISLAAAVADALDRGEHLIDLFAAGPELYVFRAGRHTAHLDNVLEILACLEPCRSDSFESLAPELAPELENISAVVCLVLDWDDSRRRLAEAILEAGCSLKVVVVREGETTEPVDAAVFGEPVHLSPQQIQSGGVETL